jgi:hypothetical protein
VEQLNWRVLVGVQVIKHARKKAELVQNLAMVRGLGAEPKSPDVEQTVLVK